MTIYKIRNKEGLFSMGGSRSWWSKQGKNWNTQAHVRSHLRNNTRRYDAMEVEVVEFEVVERKATKLSDFNRTPR